MPYAKTSFAEKTNPFQQKVFIDLLMAVNPKWTAHLSSNEGCFSIKLASSPHSNHFTNQECLTDCNVFSHLVWIGLYYVKSLKSLIGKQLKVTQEKLVKAISEVKRLEQIKIKELMFLNRSRVYQKSLVCLG